MSKNNNKNAILNILYNKAAARTSTRGNYERLTHLVESRYNSLSNSNKKQLLNMVINHPNKPVHIATTIFFGINYKNLKKKKKNQSLSNYTRNLVRRMFK